MNAAMATGFASCALISSVFGRELEGQFECWVRGGGVWRRYGEVGGGEFW